MNQNQTLTVPPEELTFDPETHTYRVFGQEVPSVTELTGIYGGPLPEEGDPLELTLEAAADRGTLMHAFLEHRLCDYPEPFELPDSLQPYADAVDLFLSEHKLDPLLIEVPLHGIENGVPFAGTPDYIGEFDGIPAVLDWKFVSQLQKAKVSAQLGGYLQLCMNNEIFPDGLYCVQFLPSGTYRLYPATVADAVHRFTLSINVHQEKTMKHPKGEIV